MTHFIPEIDPSVINAINNALGPLYYAVETAEHVNQPNHKLFLERIIGMLEDHIKMNKRT
jgi:hypothetical protein